MSNLPLLTSPQEVQARLRIIFPESFPDRGILVGDMAARMFFVSLYGGFIEGNGRYFRPSTIIRFSLEQAALTDSNSRLGWQSTCQTPGYKPLGKQWYADNTREPLRDDLIRNRAIPIGIIVKREGVPPTSPAPIYCVSKAFADLFEPSLKDIALEMAIADWQEQALDPMTLKRMRLLAHGVKSKEGQVTVVLPTTKRNLRLAAGQASIITRDVCEILSVKMMDMPVVVHISISDQKTFPELEEEAKAYDLVFDPSAELPDVVIVDLSKNGKVAFVEVVHSDGPITELRKKALLKIASDAGIPENRVLLVTAFEDRNSSPFKKRVSELAYGSSVWFRSEPELLMKLETF